VVVNVKLYVEGGGDHNKALDTKCRPGFREFFRRAGLDRRMPRIVSCGGRTAAYKSFRTSPDAGDDYFPILLVDSEAPVSGADAWGRVRSRDGWQRPDGATPDQLHLMVQAMEAWFHADKEKVEEFYGRGFRPTALSQRPEIDNIPKADLFSGLEAATRACPTKGEYSKGEHSFEILALIDPAKVRNSSPLHAGRLLNVLDRLCEP
jgi:hypothetical protein